MAITITNQSNSYNGKNLSIIFKDNNTIETKIETKIENDFVFIFRNNTIIGINVFNYQKYFQVDEGYHLVNENIKNYLLKSFPNYLNEKDFENFYQIGKIIKKTQHPNSEKLFVLDVEFKNQKLQIITNVKDVQENKNYLFAINGALTYDGTNIVESKVLNVLSQGMIVSYKTLGMDQEGLVDCTNLTINDEFKF